MQTAIAPVRHHQHWRISARINPQTVRAIQLIFAFPESAKTADELRFVIVLIDEARSVTIADVNITIR